MKNTFAVASKSETIGEQHPCKGCPRAVSDWKQPTAFIGATELAEILGISRAQSYKIIQKLNEQLEKDGYMTLTGKVSRVYFMEKFYGISAQEV